MRNEGGGFAANIYGDMGAMPESRMQVTRIAFSKSLAWKSTSKSSEEWGVKVRCIKTGKHRGVLYK